MNPPELRRISNYLKSLNVISFSTMIGDETRQIESRSTKAVLNWARGFGALVLGFLVVGGGILLDRRWRLAVFYQLLIPVLCFLAGILLPSSFRLSIAVVLGNEILAFFAMLQGAWFGLRRPKGSSFPRLTRAAKTAASLGIVVSFVFQFAATGKPKVRAGLNFFGYKSYVQAGGSMEPTLKPGDRIVVDLNAYEKSAPKVGDIVAFLREDAIFTKRVVATQGDLVEYSNSDLIVNGKATAEDYLEHHEPDDLVVWDTSKHVVGKGEVYVLGDNRFNSNDSRFFGDVPLNTVMGKVIGVYWPLSRARGIVGTK